jgi:hypothetical protein
VRLQSARHNANYLHEQCARAMTGIAFRNFAIARALRPLQLDLTQPNMVHPTSTAPAWAPPKGAELFVGLLAMVIAHWKIPKGEAHAGDPYSGIYASAEEIADALGISKNQWARGPYWRDDKLISRGGAREWLQHHRLIACYSTTTRKLPQRVPLRFGEGRYFIAPGEALLELLGIHRRRIFRNRRRVVGAWKARSQNLGSKSSVISSVLRTEDLTPHRARARGRRVPMLRQLQRVDPVAIGVDEQTRRRSKSREKPEGLDEAGGANVGGNLETQRQREPAAPGEAQTLEGLSPPPPTSGAADNVSVRELLARTLAQLRPDAAAAAISPAPVPMRPPSPPPDERQPSRIGALLAGIPALSAFLGRGQADRAPPAAARDGTTDATDGAGHDPEG